MKVPEPRQLPSGSWFIQMRLGGQSVPVTEPTRAACIRTAQLIKAEHVAGKRQIRRSEHSVGELIDAYIAKYKAVLSPSTVRNYEGIRRNRFPSVMELKPEAVRDWQKVINAELQTCSEHTVMNGWGLVSAAMKDAKIPVPDVKLAQVPENELSYLEPEEIPLFLAVAKGDPCELEMLLELHGLRASEAQQVVRADQIDLRREIINVRGAVVRGPDGFVQKKTNKSKAGTRTVPILIPRLIELVREYRSRGEALPIHGPTMVLDHVHKICAAAGVTDVTNHGLRRSLATLAYSEGITEHVLMSWGGWRDAATMHKIYIKCAARDKASAERGLKSFFQEPDDFERLMLAFADLDVLWEKYGDLEQLRTVFEEAKKARIANEKS